MSEQAIVVGDCLEVLREYQDNAFDSVVCDPPYDLVSGGSGGFMGKAWDGTGIAFDPATWQEVLRVLKPGGHLLAFGGTRTYHRMACAIEDAGFEIRDSVHWMYGSGFPKSHNLDGDRQGWGTALKPSHEPIVVARKPLVGTVAANVLKYGTGALNIDGCRISTTDNLNGGAYAKQGTERHDGAENWRYKRDGGAGEYQQPEGRWPANVIFSHAEECAEGACADGCPIAELDRQQEGASRFFYCAKASRSEREAGLDAFEAKAHGMSGGAQGALAKGEEYGAAQTIGLNRIVKVKNVHPTVKPLGIMRYLIRLVTPPGGIVLDPFAGSGTTICAAALEGFHALGIEREEEYAKIAEARLSHWRKAAEASK